MVKTCVVNYKVLIPNHLYKNVFPINKAQVHTEGSLGVLAADVRPLVVERGCLWDTRKKEPR